MILIDPTGVMGRALRRDIRPRIRLVTADETRASLLALAGVRWEPGDWGDVRCYRCDGDGVSGFGLSPLDAYAAWLANHSKRKYRWLTGRD